jgi:hypothetical protein
VATRAWPYAVSRGERSGYQAIVVPGFLAEAGQAYLLEYASKGEASEPGHLTVREVAGAATRPLSIAYRVAEARAAHYGLAGDGVLADRVGRTIRIFEGLVLRLPAEQVASVRLTAEDLDAVAEVAGPAFRKLWAAGARIDAESSNAISVGDAARGTRLLDVRIAEPYVVPGGVASRGPGHGDRRGEQNVVPLPRRPHDRVGGPVERRPGRGALVVAAVIVCVLAGLAARYFTRSSPRPVQPVPVTAQAPVRQWCADLSSGQAGEMYRQLSSSYQHSTTLASFESRLLGSGTTATCTSTATKAGQATLALRWADGRNRTVRLNLQDQTGQWRITAMKVSPSSR